jgi:hypothetical protein
MISPGYIMDGASEMLVLPPLSSVFPVPVAAQRILADIIFVLILIFTCPLPNCHLSYRNK